MEKPPRKKFKEMLPVGSWSDPVIVASSGDETDTADEFQFDTLSPQSPPDLERSHQPLEYVPKSPVYPLPDDRSEYSSVPDLETPREQMTPDPEKLEKSDHVNNLEVPADANADKDLFQDIDRQNTLRQQLSKELNEAFWNEDTSGQALTQLEKISKTVKPVHEDFWNNRDRDIFIRLNEAAKKLEECQPEVKKDAALQNSQAKDQVSPSDECLTCHQPVGHHLLDCNKDTLQQDLTEELHEIPVEPLKAPPKVVHPFPGDSTQFQLMPPPIVPANFAVRLNTVAKMKTGPASTKTKMLATITTTPQVTIHKLSPEEIRSLTTSV